ncbi:cell differentiation RCD1-like protein [Medicago truncatula]|uniref:Cell differentiation RCD1-like protein n=1 Tax=Medicago truncatula TaxID=3880 RepID=G7I5F8_MEDTR|nr:cell differentiation RCD1-like protein [Medicago truncatula]
MTVLSQNRSKLTQFEYLRLTSLVVIDALVKVKTKEVIDFLLSSEIIPLCLHNMEIGEELSKITSFMIQKILLDNDSLAYVYDTREQFSSVTRLLDMMLTSLENQPSPRLLKLIFSIYLRLSQHRRLVEKFHNLKCY